MGASDIGAEAGGVETTGLHTLPWARGREDLPHPSAAFPGAGRASPLSTEQCRLVAKLGRGGAAEVFLAELVGPGGLGRPVAVKRLHPALRGETELETRFLDEALILSSLHHRNIVDAHGLRYLDGEPVLVMEYLHGESLASYLRRRRGATPDVALAAYIVAEVASALRALHSDVGLTGEQRSILHRDVSPQNIFLTYEGEVKLIDLGIARRQGLHRTPSGMFLGKVAYAAPEQVMGQAVDARCDLFSLGTVLFELVTGRSLFARHSIEATLRAVFSEPIPRASEVAEDCPPELDRLLAQMLERETDRRIASAAEVRARLLSFLSHDRGSPFLPDRLGRSVKELFSDRERNKRVLLDRVSRDLAQTDVAAPSSVPPPVLVSPRSDPSDAVTLERPDGVGDAAGGRRDTEDLTVPIVPPVVATEAADVEPWSVGFFMSMRHEQLRSRARRRWTVRGTWTLVAAVVVSVCGGLAGWWSGPPPAPLAPAALSVVADHGWADVTIDGTYRGRTPLHTELRPGRYVVEVAPYGRPEGQRDVEIEAGADRPTKLVLRMDGVEP